jgi:hypothetical protein
MNLHADKTGKRIKAKNHPHKGWWALTKPISNYFKQFSQRLSKYYLPIDPGDGTTENL